MNKYSLHCKNFSPMYGDELYPLFDEYGDMIALLTRGRNREGGASSSVPLPVNISSRRRTTMAQKKKPQPKDKYEARHLRNLSAYEKQIDKIYEEAVKEAASLSTFIGGISGDKAFSFADYNYTAKS